MEMVEEAFSLAKQGVDISVALKLVGETDLHL